MEQWLESVHSDGTAEFVSNPRPRLFENVTIRLRMYKDTPVKHVVLRYMPNGMERLEEMQVEKRERGFVYYTLTVKMNEKRLQYQFYLVCDRVIYYYTQRGITTYLPGQNYDFALLADYDQPEWVKDAVFYQIFPERFCNGDPSNDVQSGEYTQSGYPSIRMESWDLPALRYEDGHCLDFFGGDLQGIRQKIPYLKELGITALYLNPIFFAPTSHKYDCLDYFHVDPHFGGDAALAELSKSLHENGMKLILDISINHTGIAHRWFNRDGIWFDKSVGAYNNPDALERKYYFLKEDNSYHGWFNVDTMPTLNYTSEELRDIIYRREDSVLKKWLQEPYCIDGWRFDVADTFARNDQVQLDRELWPQICAAIKEVNPQAFILAEHWGDCAQYLQGDAWDSPMNYFGCGRVIRQFLGEEDLFSCKHPALCGVPYKMTAQDAKNRILEHLAKLPYVIWENQFNLFDSHDTPRLHNNPRVNREEYRGAVLFQFLLPGAASIYYGDEAEIDGYIDAMEGCRYPMPWGKDFRSGERYQLMQTMAKLKAKHPALRRGSMQFLYAQGNVIAMARYLGQEIFVGVISTEEEDVSIRLPLGAVGGICPEGDRDLLGRTLRWEREDDRSIHLVAKAHESYFFRCKSK